MSNGVTICSLLIRETQNYLERVLMLTTDSRMLLTGSDDMHIHMYDANNASLIEAMSGGRKSALSCIPSLSVQEDCSVFIWAVT